MGFWDNPNIHPFTEFRMRRNTLVDYAREIGLSLIVEGGYASGPFWRRSGVILTGAAPRATGCACAPPRAMPRENGFTHFTTTLLISPYQNHELLAQTAREAGEEFGVAFLYRDFRPSFREGAGPGAGHGAVHAEVLRLHLQRGGPLPQAQKNP